MVLANTPSLCEAVTLSLSIFYYFLYATPSSNGTSSNGKKKIEEREQGIHDRDGMKVVPAVISGTIGNPTPDIADPLQHCSNIERVLTRSHLFLLDPMDWISEVFRSVRSKCRIHVFVLCNFYWVKFLLEEPEPLVKRSGGPTESRPRVVCF